MEAYLKSRGEAVRAHPTKIKTDKLKKMTNKHHIPGQIYLNKGLPCQFVPKKKKTQQKT